MNTSGLWIIGLIVAIMLVWAGKRYLDYLEDKREETLQHYSRGGVFERMTGTKHKGFKLHKRETPYNYIRLIIGTMLKLKKEGKI